MESISRAPALEMNEKEQEKEMVHQKKWVSIIGSWNSAECHIWGKQGPRGSRGEAKVFLSKYNCSFDGFWRYKSVTYIGWRISFVI